MNRHLGTSVVLALIFSGCGTPTEAPLVPTPEAVLWKRPFSLGMARGEVGNTIVFQTNLRGGLPRGGTQPGATITAVDAATGATRWEVSNDSIIGTNVSLGAGAATDVYVTKATAPGLAFRVAVLDAVTGQTRWQAPSCGLVPIRLGNTVITLEGESTPARRFEFVGRDADTGVERWRLNVTNDSVDCFTARLLTVRADTAVFLSAVGQPTGSAQQLVHLSANGARRIVAGPASLRSNYTTDQNFVDVRLLSDPHLILVRDTGRLTAVDITDGRLIWSSDPRPLDVSRRSYTNYAYQAIAASGDVIVVATGDSLGYPTWRATLDARTGIVTSDVRPGREDITALRQCGGTRLLAWDSRRRLLVMDGITGAIIRRFDVTLAATGPEFIRTDGVYVSLSTYAGRSVLIADLAAGVNEAQWMTIKCE